MAIKIKKLYRPPTQLGNATPYPPSTSLFPCLPFFFFGFLFLLPGQEQVAENSFYCLPHGNSFCVVWQFLAPGGQVARLPGCQDAILPGEQEQDWGAGSGPRPLQACLQFYFRSSRSHKCSFHLPHISGKF